jgi:uncharacterized protein (TIGR02145 family)
MVLFASSCVNTIDDGSDDDDTPTQITGGQSISISSYELHSQVYDSDSKVEQCVGLYVVPSSSAFNKTRSVSNERYLLVSGGFKDVDGAAVYPDGSSCNIFSYYPYQQEGLSDKSFEMSVSVNRNQVDNADYNRSDFMTAEADGVTPGSQTIELDYAHRFTRINFVINVTDNTDVNELLELNPSVMLGELYTTATYNISTKEFSDYGGMAGITPNGTWTVNGRTLQGKRAVVLPQTVDAQRNLIKVVIGGKSFAMVLGSDYKFVSGKELNVIVNFSKSSADSYSLSYSIGNWDEGGALNLDAVRVTEYDCLDINYLDFDKAPVIDVMIDFQKVAQLCRELLYNDEMKVSAVVAYPYRNGAVDLTDGILLKQIGVSGSVNGGKVVWDTTTNTFTYTGGTGIAAGVVYFNKNGALSTTAISDAAKVTIEGEQLTDARTDSTYYYSLVKIGTQYWTRENLAATTYTDGKSITKRASSTTSTAAGYYSLNDYTFYNQNAVVSGKLAPAGYRIANYYDFSMLKAYVRKDASLLKSSDGWNGGTANNLSGFSAIPCGAFTESSSSSTYAGNGATAQFWVMSSVDTATWKTAISLSADSNTVDDADYTTLSGLSVRCVKE